jgi:hypothetical protein|nr:hypothetical protein [uncultured Mediterranean phage uvMED]|tara:strand:- start:4006 stop:4206 length:201 start_codon:yes stop_codon:yes gene_type:complete
MSLNKNIAELDEKTLKEQIAVGQTIQKVNTLLDISEHLNNDSWDGVRRLELIVQIENKLSHLIDDL